MKKRIDLILVEKKIAETRSKAQAMIMAGQIYIKNHKVFKSSETYDSNIEIIFKNLHPQWVSRGAFKILHALDHFNIDVKNLICMDLGASTGGFTEVLLTKRALKIYSVDVGSNQLHEKLKKNNKIINLPKTNARYLTKELIPELIDIIVCDVSFISMKKVLKPSLTFLDKEFGIIIALIKPQFESDKNEIKRGGVVTDSLVHKRICEEYVDWFKNVCNMQVLGVTPSPITGPKGNIEFLICAKR